MNKSDGKVNELRSARISSCVKYLSMVGLNCQLFQLKNTPLSKRRQRRALRQLKRYLKEHQSNLLGYQVNQNLNYARQLAFMLDIHTNNVGDPFDNANYALNTKTIERAVSSSTPQRRKSHPEHAYHAVAFFSEDSHYSIIRAVRTLDIRTFYE